MEPPLMAAPRQNFEKLRQRAIRLAVEADGTDDPSRGVEAERFQGGSLVD
jgi:hypothetical protein